MWNVIIYGPPVETTITSIDKVTLFYNTFRDIGRVCFNEYAGDSWQRDLTYFEEHKGRVLMSKHLSPKSFLILPSGN